MLNEVRINVLWQTRAECITTALQCVGVLFMCCTNMCIWTYIDISIYFCMYIFIYLCHSSNMKQTHIHPIATNAYRYIFMHQSFVPPACGWYNAFFGITCPLNVYLYIRVCVRVCVHVCVCVWVCVSVCMYLFICMYLQICIFVCMCAYASMRERERERERERAIAVCVYLHTYIYIYPCIIRIRV